MCFMGGDIQALPEVLRHIVSRARAKKMLSLVLGLNLSDTLPLLPQHLSWPTIHNGKHLTVGWAAAHGHRDLH